MKSYTLLLASLLVTPSLTVAQDTQVTVDKAHFRAPIKEVRVPSVVNTLKQSQLSFAVEGLFKAHNVDVGAKVAQGETIAELDKQQSEAQLTELSARVRASQATLDDQQQQFDELNALTESQSVAKSELRRARAALNMARAELESRKAALLRAEVELAFHSLKAPFDGVVSARYVDLGEWVTPGTAAFELTRLDKLYIDAFLPFRYLPYVDKTTEVSVIRKDLSGDVRHYDASISDIVPTTTNSERAFRVRINELPSDTLYVGMPVDVQFDIKLSEPSTVINKDALIRYSDGRTSIWLVESNGNQMLAKQQFVNVTYRFVDFIAIEERLPETAQIVVRGNESLNDGEKVTIVSGDQHD
ncbi:efflux RND transporter periplasmic adaptor subunit [Idiomarina sp.]|jgi:RND family efflux transporter MFP subunit|uniref:efflux RND transporter periplasmic adaptor subunit n=1 Tax=Idiomarina sp. TaxID=1874361 RepID=UPI003516ACD9